MKVCYVYPHIFGVDGYPRDIHRLLNELVAGGKVEAMSIPVAPLTGLRGRPLVAEWNVYRQLQQRLSGIDLVHFFGFFFAGYPLLARYVAARGVPYWVSPLSALLPHALAEKRAKKLAFLAAGGLRLLKRAEAIHAFTDNEVQSIRALGVETTCVKHTLGIYFEDRPPDMAGLADEIGVPYLLCMGRLSIRHKGIDLALDGFAEYLRGGGRKYKLVVAGRSWLGSHDFIRQRIQELGLSDAAIFLGEVSLTRKFALIQHCAALLYPTRYDGPPRPIRDALALGKRVLITHEANIKDDIAALGWGYQFRPEAAALAAAIGQLAAEQVAPAYVDPGRVLSWNKIAADFAASYLARTPTTARASAISKGY